MDGSHRCFELGIDVTLDSVKKQLEVELRTAEGPLAFPLLGRQNRHWCFWTKFSATGLNFPSPVAHWFCGTSLRGVAAHLRQT